MMCRYRFGLTVQVYDVFERRVHQLDLELKNG